ncbi:RNA-binding domain-containing protein [Candidatus Neptunochlamydia vexilliferae]|nr:RNA-binding domain-containing protein [Candidatus Neptunochlamydia vexilliferae]
MKEKFFYEERESKALEFKSKLPQFMTLIKTCVAFANGSGGKIIIGVENDSREVIGITDQDRERLFESFPNSLYDSVSPTLLLQVWGKSYNDVSVLVIEIPTSPKKPYFLKSDGMPKGVYIRVGSSTRRATEDYIEELVREGKRLTYDEEIVREPRSILSNDLLEEFYKERVTDRRLMADKVIALSPNRKEKYAPTVAGTLFFSENPQDYVAEATVLCTRFKGDKGREIIQTQELTGPLDQLAVHAYQLASSWMERDYRLQGVKLKGKLPVPKEALREAIINALIHRKYSIPGAVKIAIYDHRCEIFNPGAFPGVVDLDSLGDGTTYLRNPHIAKIARHMGLVEKLGSGIRLIFDSCKRAGLMPPEYAEGGDFVKVTFSFKRAKKAKDSDEEAILRLIEEKGSLSVKDVVEHLRVSRNTATRRLTALIKKGKLFRKGKGPSVRYYP